MPDRTRTRTRAIGLLAGLVIGLAACGGGAAGPTGPSGASSTPAASQPGPGGSDAAGTPAVTDGGAATPASDPGTGSAATACELVTADEAAGILGSDPLTTMDTPGDIAYCLYSDADGAAAATTWMRRGGAASFSIWKSGAGVQEIDGLGDDAVFDPSSATLLVLKGDAIFSVVAGAGDEPEAKRVDWAKAFAQLAIGRM